MYQRSNVISQGLGMMGLMIASPLIVGIGICVYALDGAPAFFKQERLGLHRVPFTIWVSVHPSM